jgi:hypothetical protein
MNIFYVDKNPINAAVSLCDKHVVKMLLESAQMLCTAMREKVPADRLLPPVIYQSAHINHPCTRWVCESFGNFEWLLTHACALEKEYQLRFHKFHATRRVLLELLAFSEAGGWKLWGADHQLFTEPPQCMPEAYKVPGYPVLAYRRYYIAEKRHFAEWKKVLPPEWFQAGLELIKKQERIKA